MIKIRFTGSFQRYERALQDYRARFTKLSFSIVKILRVEELRTSWHSIEQ